MSFSLHNIWALKDKGVVEVKAKDDYPTGRDWKLTGGTNDEGEVEVAEIDVWNGDHRNLGLHLGVPSHDEMFRKLRFIP